MKRFEFSLQKVLDYRNFLEEQAETELGKANAEVSRIENELKDIANKRVSLRSESLSDVMDFVNAQQYMNLLDERTERLTEELASAKLVAEEKKEVVKQAMQKVKVLEKLKETKKIEWKKANIKADDQVVDDIVTSRFNPNTSL